MTSALSWTFGYVFDVFVGAVIFVLVGFAAIGSADPKASVARTTTTTIVVGELPADPFPDGEPFPGDEPVRLDVDFYSETQRHRVPDEAWMSQVPTVVQQLPYKYIARTHGLSRSSVAHVWRELDSDQERREQ